MFAPPSLVDHGVIEQIPRNHPTASTTNGAMPAAGGGALLFPAGTDAAGGSPRPSISRQNTSSQKRSSASTAVTISTADLVAWDQSVTEMSWLMKHVAQGVAAQQQRNAMLHQQQQQQQSNNTYYHKVRGGGLMDGNNNNHVDASNHSNNANGAGSSSSPANPTAKSAATGRPHRFGDAANIVEGAAAAVGRATSAAILLNAGHHQQHEALPLPRHVFGSGGGSILAPTGTNDSDAGGPGGESTGRSHSHGGGVSMPFVPVTFVSRSEPHKEVSLEPNGSPDVSQHSSSDHAPPGGENIHISNEGGAGGALTLTEALGGGHHKVMIQSSESANEGSGGGRTEGGNNNTPDLLVTTLSSKIAELHQHIAHVQSMFAVSIDIESFGSAFPAPEFPSPQNPQQPQLPAQRPRGFSSSQDAGGQSGGMHPHFLHSPSSASGPSPPTGNSGYYYNRGSFGPSPYQQQHNAVHQTTFHPTNASVFSAGGSGAGGAFPLSQLRSSVRIHQSVLNALNNNNNGGGPTTVSASPAMNGNHYGGYHHGMSVTENIFNAIQMEHSMSRAPGESYSKLPIPTTTTTLTKDTDETGSKSINQYLILDVIGQGACGKVKLALDLNRGTTVAIKQVRKSSKPTTTKSTESAAAAAAAATTTSPLIGSPLSMSPKLGRRVDAQLASLKREIAIMKKIRHKNVVALHEVIDDPHADKMYLIMQYVDQGSVGAVKFDGTCEALPLRKVADIVAQVASGLHFLHASGVVHRDIKPENILSSSEGHVYLSDFGVSTLTDRGNGAQAGGVNGTPLVGKQLPIGSPTFKSVSANETSATTFSPLATNMGGNGGGGGGTLLFMPPEYFKDGLTSSLNSTTSPADSTTTATGGPSASSPSSPIEGGSRLPPPPIKTSSLASTGVTLTSPFERQCAGDIWALGVTIYVLVYGRLPFATMDLLLDSSFTPEFPTTSTFDQSRDDDTMAGSTETAPPNTETVPKKLLALLKAMLSREAVLRPRPHQIRSVAKLLKRELQTLEEQESSIDNDLLMMAATMTPTSNVAPPPGLQLTSGGGIASAHSKRHGATIRVSKRDLADALTPAGGLATPPQNELLRPLDLPSSVGFDGVRGAVSPRSPPPPSAQSAEFESPSRTSPNRSLQPRPPSSETPGTRRPMTMSPGP